MRLIFLCALLVGCQTQPDSHQQFVGEVRSSQLPPEPTVKTVVIHPAEIILPPAKPLSLTFSNADIGPLYYRVEQTQDFKAWAAFASGVAFPGLTKINVEKTNASAFFRATWPSR